MNTRLQVEHPVTEEVTGLDLVAWQFRVAAGEKLPLTQSQVRFEGHAIEARVYAEDPDNGFLPSTGPIVGLELPADVRVESGVEAGGEVTPFYDPMIAKLIAHAPTREAALDRLTNALDHTLVAGVRTNIAFLGALCRAGAFATARSIQPSSTEISVRSAPCRTNPITPRRRAASRASIDDEQSQTASAEEAAEPNSPWAARDGFQLSGKRSVMVPILIDGRNAQAAVSYGKDGMSVIVDGATPAADATVFEADDEAYVLRRGRQTRVRLKDMSAAAAEAGAGDGVVKAPMHGKVLQLFVGAGDAVAGGQRLAVIEAMKMEHTLRAPFAGVVANVAVGAGTQVVEGAQIMVIERSAAE